MLHLDSFLVLGLTPVWIALLHALACRGFAKRNVSAQKLALACGVGTVLGVTMVIAIREGPGLVRCGLAMGFVPLASLMLAHVYFHIFNMSETARRIRILVELKLGRAPGQVPNNPARMISVRVERLVGLKQLRVREGKYLVVSSWLLLAARIVRWQERLLFPSRFR